jgi:nucleoside-diphosphate-sugar epimerase
MADHLIVGCGYLGRRVAQRWHAGGHRVWGTTRRPEHAAELAALGLNPVVADVLDPATLVELPRADTLLYCIGFDRSVGVSMRSVYVEGLGNLLDRLPRPGRFLYVSSTGVYGQDQGEEVDETAATEPADESGQTVLQAEQLLRGRLPEAIMLRFAGIYGPGRLLRVGALKAGEPLVGDPDRWLNLIHVEDGAGAVLAAAERGRPGAVYNVSDDRPILRGDFYGLLARLLDAPPPHFVKPEPGTPPLRHERANRRIVNHRVRRELGVQLSYPTCAEGLPVSLLPAARGVQA